LSERSAQQAEVDGERATALEERDRALHGAAAAQQQRLRVAEEERTRAEEQLRAAREETREAETRANDALARLGNAHEEGARGTVITLPTGILFTTGNSNLLPGSKTQLDQVAQALKQVGERDIDVEGYTDSVGGEAQNQVLSQQRAEAVRSYLIGQGVPAGRVTARGMGEGRPLGDNSTVEGRAKNRRVEIVVHPATPPVR
jgi:outer membrane protein OmpA-like peptidoglycan-associated protein